MHRSRLHVVLIDSPPDRAQQSLAFWSAALGVESVPEEGTPFTRLSTLGSGAVLAHQRLEDGPPRMHLDLETDDTVAEVNRLERLGATRFSETGGCVQLRDPSGMVFCVVPIQSDDFDQHATTWT
jgi:hypothetical protein